MNLRSVDNRVRLAGRIATLVLALALLEPVDAGAVMVTGQEMIGWSESWERDDLQSTVEPLVSLEMVYRAWGEPETLEVLAERMLRDENWDSWRRYQATTETRVPLAATQQFLESATRLSRLDKRLQVRLTRERPPFPEEEVLEKAFRLFNPQDQIGKVTAAPVERAYTPFKLFSFLMEDDGVFSGRAWSWDNFLPRIATISAIVLGGLSLVEFLRLVANLGIRRLVKRNRKQG